MSLGVPNIEGGRSSQSGFFHGFGSIFSGSSIKGFRARQNSPLAMSVLVGGESGIDDSIFVRDGANGTFPIFNPDGEAIEVAVQTASPTNPRIDAIVIYIDGDEDPSQDVYDNTNKVKAMAVAGTPGAVPSAPNNSQILAAINASSIYTIVGTIAVPAAGTTITDAMITDARVPIGLPDGIVKTDTLASSVVTAPKLSSNAVTTSKITDANVTTAKIADAAVTSPKLALSKTTDANGWTVCDFGAFKRYSKRITYSQSVAASSIASLGISASNFPAAITNIGTNELTFSNSSSTTFGADHHIAMESLNTGSSTAFTFSIRNLSTTTRTFTGFIDMIITER